MGELECTTNVNFQWFDKLAKDKNGEIKPVPILINVSKIVDIQFFVDTNKNNKETPYYIITMDEWPIVDEKPRRFLVTIESVEKWWPRT